jgi:phage-related protein
MHQNWYTVWKPQLSVRFYRSTGGNEPVRAWLQSLNKSAHKAIGQDIKTVQIGWPLGMPLVRKLEPGLWEIRSDIPAGTARVLFTTLGATLILLHGFIKKSNATPETDLKTARQRKKEMQYG